MHTLSASAFFPAPAMIDDKEADLPCLAMDSPALLSYPHTLVRLCMRACMSVRMVLYLILSAIWPVVLPAPNKSSL